MSDSRRPHAGGGLPPFYRTSPPQTSATSAAAFSAPYAYPNPHSHVSSTAPVSAFNPMMHGIHASDRSTSVATMSAAHSQQSQTQSHSQLTLPNPLAVSSSMSALSTASTPSTTLSTTNTSTTTMQPIAVHSSTDSLSASVNAALNLPSPPSRMSHSSLSLTSPPFHNPMPLVRRSTAPTTTATTTTATTTASGRTLPMAVTTQPSMTSSSSYHSHSQQRLLQQRRHSQMQQMSGMPMPPSMLRSHTFGSGYGMSAIDMLAAARRREAMLAMAHQFGGALPMAMSRQMAMAHHKSRRRMATASTSALPMRRGTGAVHGSGNSTMHIPIPTQRKPLIPSRRRKPMAERSMSAAGMRRMNAAANASSHQMLHQQFGSGTPMPTSTFTTTASRTSRSSTPHMSASAQFQMKEDKSQAVGCSFNSTDVEMRPLSEQSSATVAKSPEAIGSVVSADLLEFACRKETTVSTTTTRQLQTTTSGTSAGMGCSKPRVTPAVVLNKDEKRAEITQLSHSKMDISEGSGQRVAGSCARTRDKPAVSVRSARGTSLVSSSSSTPNIGAVQLHPLQQAPHRQPQQQLTAVAKASSMTSTPMTTPMTAVTTGMPPLIEAKSRRMRQPPTAQMPVTSSSVKTGGGMGTFAPPPQRQLTRTTPSIGIHPSAGGMRYNGTGAVMRSATGAASTSTSSAPLAMPRTMTPQIMAAALRRMRSQPYSAADYARMAAAAARHSSMRIMPQTAAALSRSTGAAVPAQHSRAGHQTIQSQMRMSPPMNVTPATVGGMQQLQSEMQRRHAHLQQALLQQSIAKAQTAAMCLPRAVTNTTTAISSSSSSGSTVASASASCKPATSTSTSATTTTTATRSGVFPVKRKVKTVVPKRERMGFDPMIQKKLGEWLKREFPMRHLLQGDEGEEHSQQQSEGHGCDDELMDTVSLATGSGVMAAATSSDESTSDEGDSDYSLSAERRPSRRERERAEARRRRALRSQKKTSDSAQVISSQSIATDTLQRGVTDESVSEVSKALADDSTESSLVARAHSKKELMTKNVKLVEWQEFKQFMHSVVAHLPFFQARLKALRDFCTPIQDCDFLWITIPEKEEKALKLVISKGGWYTNCSSEKTMMGYKSEAEDLRYYYVRLYEGRDINTPLLSVRTDVDGRVAELVWLQKGHWVSGTDVMAIFSTLETALGIVLVYLHDDSKVQYSGNSVRGATKVYLKQLKSIATGFSWYEGFRFLPAKCEEWPSDDPTDQSKKLTFDQDPARYRKAIKLVRETSLRELRHLIEINHGPTTKLLKKFDVMLSDVNAADLFLLQFKGEDADADAVFGEVQRKRGKKRLKRPLYGAAKKKHAEKMRLIAEKAAAERARKSGVAFLPLAKVRKLRLPDYEPVSNPLMPYTKDFFSDSQSEDEIDEVDDEYTMLGTRKRFTRARAQKKLDERANSGTMRKVKLPKRWKRCKLFMKVHSKAEKRQAVAYCGAFEDDNCGLGYESSDELQSASSSLKCKLEDTTAANAHADTGDFAYGSINASYSEQKATGSISKQSSAVSSVASGFSSISAKAKPRTVVFQKHLKSVSELALACFMDVRDKRVTAKRQTLLRAAKERMIQMYEICLVPHTKKDRDKFSQEYKDFEEALEAIEKTKVFTRVSKTRLNQYKDWRREQIEFSRAQLRQRQAQARAAAAAGGSGDADASASGTGVVATRRASSSSSSLSSHPSASSPNKTRIRIRTPTKTTADGSTATTSAAAAMSALPKIPVFKVEPPTDSSSAVTTTATTASSGSGIEVENGKLVSKKSKTRSPKKEAVPKTMTPHSISASLYGPSAMGSSRLSSFPRGSSAGNGTSVAGASASGGLPPAMAPSFGRGGFIPPQRFPLQFGSSGNSLLPSAPPMALTGAAAALTGTTLSSSSSLTSASGGRKVMEPNLNYFASVLQFRKKEEEKRRLLARSRRTAAGDCLSGGGVAGMFSYLPEHLRVKQFEQMARRRAAIDAQSKKHLENILEASAKSKKTSTATTAAAASAKSCNTTSGVPMATVTKKRSRKRKSPSKSTSASSSKSKGLPKKRGRPRKKRQKTNAQTAVATLKTSSLISKKAAGIGGEIVASTTGNSEGSEFLKTIKVPIKSGSVSLSANGSKSGSPQPPGLGCTVQSDNPFAQLAHAQNNGIGTGAAPMSSHGKAQLALRALAHRRRMQQFATVASTVPIVPSALMIPPSADCPPPSSLPLAAPTTDAGYGFELESDRAHSPVAVACAVNDDSCNSAPSERREAQRSMIKSMSGTHSSANSGGVTPRRSGMARGRKKKETKMRIAENESSEAAIRTDTMLRYKMMQNDSALVRAQFTHSNTKFDATDVRQHVTSLRIDAQMKKRLRRQQAAASTSALKDLVKSSVSDGISDAKVGKSKKAKSATPPTIKRKAKASSTTSPLVGSMSAAARRRGLGRQRKQQKVKLTEKDSDSGSSAAAKFASAIIAPLSPSMKTPDIEIQPYDSGKYMLATVTPTAALRSATKRSFSEAMADTTATEPLATDTETDRNSSTRFQAKRRKLADGSVDADTGLEESSCGSEQKRSEAESSGRSGSLPLRNAACAESQRCGSLPGARLKLKLKQKKGRRKRTVAVLSPQPTRRSTRHSKSPTLTRFGANGELATLSVTTPPMPSLESEETAAASPNSSSSVSPRISD